MPKEDAFKGAQTALTFLYAYQGAVGREFGVERATNLQTRVSESMGARQGKMLKEQSEINDFDAKTAATFLKGLKESMGMTFEIAEESPQKVVIRTLRCPFFEAAMAAGIDPKAIEAGCSNGPMKVADSLVKQLNSSLSVRVSKFRTVQEGFCDEEISLG